MDKQERIFGLIEAQSKSGESVRSFATRHGVSIQTWYNWRRKYLAARPQHEFKEIVLEGSGKPDRIPKLELQLPCGTHIKIY